MKPLFTGIVLLLSFLLHAQSVDTTIRGVRIGFRYTTGIFPASWLAAPISAEGEQIDGAETKRSKAVIAKALNKYPLAALNKELKAVYFLRAMKFYAVGYGATNSRDILYLSNDGVANGYTDLYVEQIFHHEFSSILYRNHPSWLDEQAWENANFPGFNYNDPENGVGAIRNNASSQDLDTALCRKGFLTEYSLSGMENDINTFAQNLFSPSAGFWKIAEQYPRIKTKIRLLIAFYNRLDPVFTEEYFKRFNR